MKRFGYTIFLMGSLLISTIGSPIVAQDTRPTSTPNVDSQFDPVRFNAPDLTGEGRPTQGHTDTATRGSCKISSKEVSPLVPPSYVGWTDAGHPTFWFSIPYGEEDFDTLNFMLMEIREDGSVAIIYEKMMKAPASLPGIIGVALPESVPELEVGKTYDWYLEFYCIDPMATPLGGQPNATIAGGIIRRKVPDDLERDLEATTTARERAIAYAEHGFWYDALTLVADLNRSNPGDPTFAADWKSLLSDVELADIVTEPIVECCFVEEKQER
ncbi:MAG: DUF928 domain-containing protein [Limnospira sp.]